MYLGFEWEKGGLRSDLFGSQTPIRAEIEFYEWKRNILASGARQITLVFALGETSDSWYRFWFKFDS